MKNAYAQELDEYENKIIGEFRHTIDSILHLLPEENFSAMLLQRRIFSLDFFERFYNRCIVGLDDEAAKVIGRGIVREEYPFDRQNHREDNVMDLMTIGLEKKIILSTTASPTTLKTIDAMLDLVSYDSLYYDVKAVTMMRVAGEILEGVEFGIISQELEDRYGLTKQKSVFYGPHANHDAKCASLGSFGISHADRFGCVLVELVDSEEKLAIAKKMMKPALEVKMGFYEQFV